MKLHRSGKEVTSEEDKTTHPWVKQFCSRGASPLAFAGSCLLELGVKGLWLLMWLCCEMRRSYVVWSGLNC